MQITPASLAAIYYNYNVLFQKGFEGTTPWYDRLAMTAPSGGSENRYAFMNAIPKMREWLGDRVAQNVSASGYALVNRDWELTIELDRNTIDDDQLGVFNPQVEMMGVETRKHPDDLVLDLMQNGQTKTCFDGQYFFDTDHPQDPQSGAAGSQQNYWSSGKALSYDNYAAVRAKMRAFKGANGRPLRVNPRLLVVPPALEATARLIVESEFLPSTAGTAAQTNVYRGTAEVLVIEELDGQDTTWYLFDVSKPVKPFVYQLRQAPRWYQETSPESESVRKRKKFTYGVDMRDAAGFGLWFLGAKAVA
jgi:phage major head subunit gpT-like protein